MSRLSVIASVMLIPLAPAFAAGMPPTDADYMLQGEYAAAGHGLNIVALGGGKFMAVHFKGGLPGAGADKSSRRTAEAQSADGKVEFSWPDAKISLAATGAELTSGGSTTRLEKLMRQSPTLGAKPPEGAVVLFDGTSADAFQPGKVEDGLLCQGANSKAKFKDHSLHIEFMLPYKPQARGQGRGNSGVYLQGRYEVQVLDSFGLEGKNNEAGGIYSIKDPDLNMCFPPMTWQTYDIDFTAATFAPDGKKTANARITVRHNGVVVHDNVELPQGTTAAPVKEGPEPSYLHLQDHGNPVRYRNIWVVEKSAAP
jgi:hypothetical protein